ncbi:MAG: DUF5828 family protein [Candidatus Nanohaloarchaea archaeon]|nr:DUF5828 family protein [Candidatus Nanohaloarchaea archaeon]
MEQSGREMVEEGEWDDVVSFCAAVSNGLDAADVERDGFEAWRPKDGEDRSDVGKRTVDAESLGETRFEAASNGARHDLEAAGGRMRDSGAELVRGRPRESAQKAGEAGEATATGLGSMLAKLLRGLERGIYRHIVEPTNPEYFESEAMSATIERCGVQNRRYRCRIVFDDPDTCAAVAASLTE